LPTDCADPVERVARCRNAMQDAKRTHELVPAAELVDLTQYSTPVLATAAVRLASRLRLADRVTPPFNLDLQRSRAP
jgi:diacylglycerol O-acyltransferase